VKRPLQGFSLVETLLAVLLLAIGLFAMAAIPVMTTKLTVQNLHRGQALLLALMKLEELEGAVSVPSVTEQTSQINPRYALSWNKIEGSEEGANVLRVIVFWDDVRGVRQELMVERAVSPFAAETAKDDK
jgi:Tfp pilus assembly protein PilE